jgi:hypothetical protein
LTSIFEKISPEEVINLHSLGFKVVPISEDGVTPTIEWTKVYENGWVANELANVKFSNVATCFGKTHLKDESNRDLYLNCLDIDSKPVFERLAIVTDELKKERFFISKLCNLTYVTQTRKTYGRHVYWLSHSPHAAIRYHNCKPGFEFEIKTDKSGLASLPPSRHRAGQGFGAI